MSKKAPTDRNEENTALAKKVRQQVADTTGSDEHKAGFVHFVSARKEVSTYEIQVAGVIVRPHWDKSREHLVWRVPAEHADRFALHHHVVTGRVLRAAE